MAKMQDSVRDVAEGKRLDPRFLGGAAPVAGIPGPGHWFVIEYAPTALFSLKTSLATSTVGKTLLVPTPYAIKMAIVDAGFRAGFSDADCATLLQSLISVEVRVAPPVAAVVSHTFLKVRQEARAKDSVSPYTDTIAYREFVHFDGLWRWAFNLSSCSHELPDRLVGAVAHVCWIGKRGSFIQFVSIRRQRELGAGFTQPVEEGQDWILPPRAHVATLDDFGPEADLETLSSYSSARAKGGKHRRWAQTVVPLGLVSTGPGFSEYRSGATYEQGPGTPGQGGSKE